MLFKRLNGPEIIDSQPIESIDPVLQHKMIYDERTVLALVAALLYSKEDITPGPVVDRAAALIREVNAR